MSPVKAGFATAATVMAGLAGYLTLVWLLVHSLFWTVIGYAVLAVFVLVAGVVVCSGIYEVWLSYRRD